MLVWGPERSFSARTKWCADSPFCPTGLKRLLASKAQGKTVELTGVLPMMRNVITITVIGGGSKERLFAEFKLVPILLKCVRVLAYKCASSTPVHVTYCNACGDRILPTSKGAVITSEHVNGGVSMGHVMGVMVFRRQDAEKVLIHELLHLFDVDKSLLGLSPSIEARTARPIDGLWTTLSGSSQVIRIGLNEAYTDAISCIIFCGDISRARAHAVEVAAKVLSHFECGDIPFAETTHVFAYYIVKAAMLVNADEFIALLTSQVNGITVDNPTMMVRFMDKSLHSPAFQSAVKQAMRNRGVPGVGRSADQGRIEMTDGGPCMTQFSKIGV